MHCRENLPAQADNEHDPEKHALGLDPWVATGFSDKIMLD
jgi:hypothetical protein